MASVCEQFVAWAREAVDEWDGTSNADLFALLCARLGLTPRQFFFDGREPTDNERHLLNLLSWREKENAEMKAELARLRGEPDGPEVAP
jgi:hypothetical protein